MPTFRLLEKILDESLKFTNSFLVVLFHSIEGLSKDYLLQDEISEDEISKRALQSAKITFSRLKSTFVGLTKQTRSRKKPGKPGPSSSKKLLKLFVMFIHR